jgi:uncharacterized protein YcnI
MRCSGWSSLAISVCSVALLLAAPPAYAHVIAQPAFVPSGSSASISLAAPNERDAPMTGFAITAPDGIALEHAHEVDGWSESLEGSTATWMGGSLAPDAEATFGATVEAETEPGVVRLTAEQRYDDGSVVTWPVDLTITPAEDSPTQNLALAGVVGLLGLLVVVAIAMVAWRRRA